MMYFESQEILDYVNGIDTRIIAYQEAGFDPELAHELAMFDETAKFKIDQSGFGRAACAPELGWVN